ncbi:MAG: glycosyltransferase family 2 protein, partial [Lactovum sp.]
MCTVLLVIPAYNEEASIKNTIRMIQEFKQTLNLSFQLDYIVVNDGSSDQTASIVRAMNVVLLDLEANMGLTGAFMAGMRYAKRKDYDYVIQFDADGQHLPDYISEMVSKA